MSNLSILEDLNPRQREAVTATEGPVLVIAGAGSGKTRVITRRITYLIEEKGVAPREIYAATFTNKAAREMKRRVASPMGLTERFTICDATDQIGLLRNAINELGHNPKYLKPANVREIISLAKMALLEGEAAVEFIEKKRDRDQAEIYRLYQRRLRESDAVDFDDLLLMVVKLWRENPEVLKHYQERFRYVLVDEYQDTNLAQFELVQLLAGGHRNICVVGDEDQSIYSWRGADIRNLLDFQKQFPEAVTIRLEQNYRSTGNILAAAAGVIERNTQRLGKKLWTESEKGDPILVIDAADEREEAKRIARQMLLLRAEGLPLDEIAIFYRANALSRVYEEALREHEIEYRVVGGVGFYDRLEIKDLLAYLQAIVNPGNALALLRIVNRPKRGIGKMAVSRLVSFADARRLPLFEVLSNAEHLKEAGLKGKALAGGKQLADWIVEWSLLADKATLREMAENILEKTEYVARLGDPKALEVISRTENINEFLGALDQYAQQAPDADLGDYLETVALRAAGDEETRGPGVSLMTVHNAKGLEFDVVFIVALEKDLFPNARAVREQGHYEEERRLFYVALTRARKRVYLSHTHTRFLYGSSQWPSPSQFLYEIPKKLRVSLERAKLKALKHEPPKRKPEAAPRNESLPFSSSPPSPPPDISRDGAAEEMPF